jgi:virulence-associated protein VagC
MTTAQIIELDGTQAVRLPEEFRFASATVSIRKDGQAVVLEPLKTTTWPPDFFEAIHITDPAFARPPQGQMPPALTFS